MRSLFYVHGKRLFFALVMLFAFSATGLSAEDVIPDRVTNLEQTARACLDRKDYSGAQSLYEDIIREYPHSDYAVNANKDIVLMYVRSGQYATADASLAQLYPRLSDSSKSRHAIKDVGVAWYREKQLNRALDVFNRMMIDYPDRPMNLLIQRLKICSYLRLDKRDEAESEIALMFSTYRNHPDLAKCACTLAQSCLNRQDVEQARSICNQLIPLFPNETNVAFLDQTINIYTLLQSDQLDKAEAGIDGLFTDFREDPDFTCSLCSLARFCLSIEKPKLALSICDRFLQTFPENSESLQMQSTLACAYVALGNLERAEAEQANILTMHGDNPKLAEEINRIASGYHLQKHNQEAIKLYQKALTENPSYDQKLDAWAGIARSAVWVTGTPAVAEPNDSSLDLRLREIPDVDVIVQRLLKDYPDSKRLGLRIFQIGSQYYYQGEQAIRNGDQEGGIAGFQKAIAIWQKNIDEISDPQHRAMAIYYSGVASGYLNNETEALTYYQRVVNEYPDYEKTWYAQYQIAQYTEKLASESKATVDDVRAAYQMLLIGDPNSPAVHIATQKLNTL